MKALVTACLIAAVISVPCQGADHHAELAKVVKHIAEGEHHEPDFDVLAKHPYEAAGLLIKELHVIRKPLHIIGYKQYHYPEAMHVVWCLRALRYLTGGMDFTAKTTYKFKHTKEEDLRKNLLTVYSESDLPFFSVWMSRDSVFFAPPDTQAAIIEKWKRWYVKEGKTFPYKPAESVNDWYL